METVSALPVPCEGHRWILLPEVSDADVFSDLRLNKRLSKQSWNQRFERAIAVIVTSLLCIIGLDNGLSPVRHKVIIWINNDFSSIIPQWTDFEGKYLEINQLYWLNSTSIYHQQFCTIYFDGETSYLYTRDPFANMD